MSTHFEGDDTTSRDEGRSWTAGIPVESAADIASQSQHTGPFGSPAGDEPPAAPAANGHPGGHRSEPVEPPPPGPADTPGWTTAGLIDTEDDAGPTVPGVPTAADGPLGPDDITDDGPDPEEPAAEISASDPRPAGSIPSDSPSAEVPITEASAAQDPITETLAEQARGDATMPWGSPPAPPAGWSSQPPPPASPPKVRLDVWVDAELRRRLQAAHLHTSDDEGYGSVSDRVAEVIERDVDRLERTYNAGASFSGGDEPPPGDAVTYQVRARHSDGLWELQIDEAGVTLSPTLAGAETMARTYVSVLYGISVEAVLVQIVPELDGNLNAEVARSRQQVADAEHAVEQARAALAAAEDGLQQVRSDRERVTQRLGDCGLSESDAETVLAITPDEGRPSA